MEYNTDYYVTQREGEREKERGGDGERERGSKVEEEDRERKKAIKR